MRARYERDKMIPLISRLERNIAFFGITHKKCGQNRDGQRIYGEKRVNMHKNNL